MPRRPLRVLALTARGLLWLVMLLVIVVLATLDLLRRPAGQDLVRRQVLQQTAKLLPGLRVGQIGGDFTGSVALKDVVLDDRFGGAAIRADRIALRYDLFRLALDGELRITSLELDGPELHVRRAKNGKLNLAELVVLEPGPEEPPSEPTSLRLRLDRLRIRGGRLVIEGGQAPIEVLDLDVDLAARGGVQDLSVTLDRIAARVKLPDGRRIRGEVRGRAGLDARRVAAAIVASVEGLTPRGSVTLDLQAHGPHARVALTARVGLPGEAALALKGWAGLDPTGTPRYQLGIRLHRIDPSRLMAGLIPAEVNLELSAGGEGIPLQPRSRSELTLKVGPSQVHGYRLKSLDLRATTRDDGWKLERLKLRAAGGGVSAAGQGTLARVDATVSVNLPSLQRLPARVKRLGLPRDLSGAVSLRARVKGPVSGPLSASCRLRIRELAVAGIRLQQADLDAAFRGLPGAPSGKLKLEATGLDPGDRRLALDRVVVALEGTPRRLKLDLSADGPRVRARVATEVTIAGQRISALLRRLELAALGHRVDLRNEPTLQVQGGRRIAISETRLATLGGVVALRGVFRPGEFPRLEARIAARGVRPPGLRRPVDARVTLRLERRAVIARVEGEIPSLGSTLRLQARLPVRYRGGPFPAGPSMAREGELELKVRRLGLALLNDLAPDLPRAAGEADLDLEVRGKLEDPQVHLVLGLRRAGLGQVTGVSSTTRLDVAGQQTRLSHRASLAGRPLVQLDASVATSLGPLLRGPLDLSRVGALPVDLRLEVKPTRIASLPRVHPLLGRFDGTASTRLQIGGTVLRPTVWLRTLLEEGSIDGTMKLGRVAGEVTVAVAADSISASVALDRDGAPLLRVKGDAGLVLERLVQGAAPGSCPIAVQVRVPGYALSRLAGVAPAFEGLAGTLDLSAKIEGTSAAPTGKLKLRVAGAGYTGVPIGDLTANAAFDGRQLDTDLTLTQPHKGRLRWRGGWRPLTGTGLEGRVVGQGLDLGFLHRLVPPLKESAGKLSLDLKTRGSLRRPVVTGHVVLKQGRLRLRGVSALKGIGARVELEPRRIRLVQLGLRGDEGTLTVTGDVGLSQEGLDASRGAALLERFSLLARARGFGLDTGQITGLEFSGDVSVSGGLRGQTLAVKLKVDDGVVKVPQVEGGRELHQVGQLPDVVFVDERGAANGEKPASAATGASPPAIGLRVELGADPLFVRGEELDLEVVTHLLARTDARGRMRIKGQVEVRRGSIRALNNTFDVRQATVSFSDQPNPDPALNVLLARDAPDATVLVQLTGTASAPKLTLRSDPPVYDQGQIMSLLLTGRVDARPESGEGGDQTMAVASAVSQVLLGNIAQKIAPKVGLDVAKVNLDQSKNKQTGESQLRAEAEVGKFITERIYVAYRRVFGATTEENANEALMEYRISASWLLMALFGDAGVGGVDLFWNMRY